MKEYFEVYEQNKRLDAEFDKYYNLNSDEIKEKNILELLVELGELANETRVFKYWSNKSKSEDEIILAELADCLIMILSFANMSNIKLEEVIFEKTDKDVVEEFIYLYKLSATLTNDGYKELICKLIVEIINLGHLLGYSDDIIATSCLRKIALNFKRFENNFNA